MSNLYYPSNEKATVFGDTAKLIKGIAVTVAVISAIALISKALKYW